MIGSHLSVVVVRFSVRTRFISSRTTTQILSFDYLLVNSLLQRTTWLVFLVIYYWRCLPWWYHGHDEFYFYFRCCCYRSIVSLRPTSVRWIIDFFVFNRKCMHLVRNAYFVVEVYRNIVLWDNYFYIFELFLNCARADRLALVLNSRVILNYEWRVLKKERFAL